MYHSYAGSLEALALHPDVPTCVPLLTLIPDVTHRYSYVVQSEYTQMRHEQGREIETKKSVNKQWSIREQPEEIDK